MNPSRYPAWSFGLSLAGMLFAGYLSFYRLLTGTCALSEPCPYFLGYPACWYGFGLFTVLTLVSGAMLLKKVDVPDGAKTNAAISFLGILFAGNLVVQEVWGWYGAGRFQGYGLGLPTCVYGLVFYIAVFAISVSCLVRHPRP